MEVNGLICSLRGHNWKIERRYNIKYVTWDNGSQRYYGATGVEVKTCLRCGREEIVNLPLNGEEMNNE